MVRSLVCTAVVVFFVVAFSAEAARHHENFSQGTYYEQTPQETEKPLKVEQKEEPVVDPKKEEAPVTDKPQPAPVDTTIPDRYPHGYPGQERYREQMKQLDNADPEAAYSGYKSTNVQYNTVTTNTDPSETIPDRYPRGYPGTHNPIYSTDPESKFQEGKYVSTQVEPSDDNAVIPNRYPHGYYGNADIEAETQGEAEVYTGHNVGKHVSYSTDVNSNAEQQMRDADEKMRDVVDRYPHGYYPSLNDNPEEVTDPKKAKTYQQNQVSYQQFPDNKPRFGYEGIQGDFSTQLQGTEIPFELTGGACPSEYWVSNPSKWPRFFNIKSKVSDAFGEKAKEVYGDISLLDALTDSRAEPYSRLVHQSTTAIFNSYSRAQYSFKHTAVIQDFNAALDTPASAEKQADTFEKANVSVFSAGIGGSCT